ncbi:hypothetical protein HO805_07075 [Streptococcus suis]|nr:hypothetical protein [Streptococcus suis]
MPTTWSGFSGDYEKYLGLGVGQNSNNHREFVNKFIFPVVELKHELLRFASQILSPTFNSPLDC